MLLWTSKASKSKAANGLKPIKLHKHLQRLLRNCIATSCLQFDSSGRGSWKEEKNSMNWWHFYLLNS